MVFTAKLAQPVGIIEPAHGGLHMEALAVGVALDLFRAERFHQRNKFFQVAL